MSSTSAATQFSLTVIRASEIKWSPSFFRSKCPSLYVQIRFNGISRRTRTVKLDLIPEWNEVISFGPLLASRDTMLNIQVRHDSPLKDICVGKIEVGFDNLLEKCVNGKETELCLNMSRGSELTETTAILCLCLEMINTRAHANINIESTGQCEITALAANIASNSSEYIDLYTSVGTLVSKLDGFVRLVDTVSEVHPYINFAWQVSSALFKTIAQTFEVDQRIVKLVHAMRDAFDFVEQIESLSNKPKKLETTIIQLLKQTDECCLFIQEYARRNFAMRSIKLNTNFDATINHFLESFRSLKAAIDSETIVHSAFVTARISSRVDASYTVLETRLQPEKMRAFDRPRCLPGTRTEILHRVIEWALSGSNQNVFWLHGAPGSGKSTVSTTVAEYFRGISRLGAHLFFELGKSEPSSVICTLAYKLASFDSTVANHVIYALEQDKDIGFTSATTQFENLLRGPLVQAGDAMQGPVIIVIDALDECGTQNSRKGLLELFRDGFTALPKNFRFFITSRKESDIDRALSFIPESICTVELEHGSPSCKDDVLRYIDHELRKVFNTRALIIPDDWHSRIDSLAESAAGVFVWASTAVKLIENDVDPALRLEVLTQNLSGLDQLYDSVLEDSRIQFDNEKSKAHFSRVLGLILLCKIPLSDDTIDRILGYPHETSLRLVISQLPAVLAYGSGSVHFRHMSFCKYLLSPERIKDPWFINFEVQRGFIALRCFDMMKDKLRFNICNLQSSYIPNDQIVDLSNRIKINIPFHIEYMCLFWVHHLREVPFSPELHKKLSEFLHNRLLYWLEVMSLLGTVNMAGPALAHAMNWVSTHDVGLLAFLRDARRTITLYSLPMSQCTTHIYTSVLPLAAKNSKVMAHYFNSNASTVKVEYRGNKQQSPLLKELTGHTSPVFSVGFSHDGTRVVSGSSDKTIRIWDAESERIVSDPLKGHTNWVRSVAFSPNGKHIVSGSADKTIMIWDVENGQTAPESLGGHASWVWSVAFSPDGTRIASGSADKTIKIWDVASRKLLSGPLLGHTRAVLSVTFSPGGNLIASGSDDRTIRVWNPERAQAVSQPFLAHAGGVKCVRFSPCGTRLVSGSDDKTILIWNVDNGQVIYGPFQGHRGTVSSVAFSHDGNRIVSCSSDRTIRIWDVESGQVVSGPFEGHTDRIHSVGFSPDGAYVVSGSDDKTVRIWDAEHGQIIPERFGGHTEGINSIAFSHNGKYIVSGSLDKVIRIWDVESGSVVEGIQSWSPLLGKDRVASNSLDEIHQIWDTENGQACLRPHDTITGQALSNPSPAIETYACSVCDNSEAQVWSTETGQFTPMAFEGHTSCVTSIACSPSGLYVVTGSQDKTIIIWSVENRRIISGPFEGHTDPVSAVAFSSNSTCVVSGSADKTVIVWHVQSGQVMSGPLEGHTGNICSVAFSPDGTLVVSGSLDKTIRIWNVNSGQVICAPLKGHTGPVLSVAFSPDGKHVVSGSEDKTIRIWTITSPNIDWALYEDGWIRRDSGELLLWIPTDLRQTLCLAQNTAVFNCQFSTKLDFTHAAHGEQWQECFVPHRF